MESLTKKRRLGVSKNRKRATWRKHSNVADVEDFIDEQRDEERTGGPFSGKLDQELFVVEEDLSDVVPTTKAETVDSLKQSSSDLPVDTQKAALDSSVTAVTDLPPKFDDSDLWMQLRCFKSLAGGRGPIKQKPHLQKTLEMNSVRLQRLTRIMDQRKDQRQRIAAKKLAAKLTATNVVRESKRQQDPVFNRNLWAETKLESVGPTERDPALAKPLRQPKTMRAKQRSGIIPVEVPHPGASYNPSPLDHQRLLEDSTMIAVQKTLEERKLMAYSKRRKAADKSAQDVWMEEMEQGLPGAPEAKLSDTVVDGFEDGDSSAVFPAAQKGRKTKKERRKEQQLQVQGSKRKSAKLKRLKENEVYRAKKIMKDILRKDAKDAEKGRAREMRLKDPQRIHKLGKHRFVEADPDVKLKEEVTSSLRSLQPEGSLLMDRYKSLQKRNILEPRRRQKIKRKYKLKTIQIQGRKITD